MRILIVVFFCLFAQDLRADKAPAVNAFAVPEPTNIAHVRDELNAYYTNGEYTKQVNEVIAAIRSHVNSVAKTVKRPAVVFDADDTLIDTHEFRELYEYGFERKLWRDWQKQAKAKAVPGMVPLVKELIKNDIAVFVLTGRDQVGDTEAKDVTVTALTRAGFPKLTGYIFQTEADRSHFREKHKSEVLKNKNGMLLSPTAQFKAAKRAELISQGYHIIANVGDQWTDLQGGNDGGAAFKMPNPFYRVD